MQKIGRLFLGLICSPLLVLSGDLWAQIDLPDEPQPQEIPHRSETQKAQDMNANSEQRHKLFEEAGMVKKDDLTPPELKRDQQLLEQSLKPIPLDFFWYSQLCYTSLTTSGSDRKDYTTDPSVGTSFLYRLSKNAKPDELNTWTGFRMHFFSGSGRQKGVNGRYSFSYFGPTIAVGRISLGQGDVDKDAFSSQASIAKALTIRHGFFAIAGLSGVSIEGDHEATTSEEEPKDFASKSVGFDSPGLFAEFLYTGIHYNALSYNAIAGVQMGEHKTFSYFGLGISAWL